MIKKKSIRTSIVQPSDGDEVGWRRWGTDNSWGYGLARAYNARNAWMDGASCWTPGTSGECGGGGGCPYHVDVGKVSY